MDKFHNTKNLPSTSKKSSNDKSIDADSMIKNIISQHDTFVVNKDHQFYSNLPKWMIPKSGFVHPLYEQIWQYVKSDKRDRTCDTNLVSQLLMTSGLPIDVLGGLWSMANVGVEGSLSQQELYIILALITLVQNGYSVSNISLLQHIHKPIIPQLNYTLIEKKHNTSGVKLNVEHKPEQVINKPSTIPKSILQRENIHVNNFQQPNFNIILSEDHDPLAVAFIEPKLQTSRIAPLLTTNLEPKSLDLAPVNNDFETFDDEFSDFQCAQFTYTDSKNNHNVTDFQTTFDTLSVKESTEIIEHNVELLNAKSIDSTLNVFESKPNLISYHENNIHDKYEVLRSLATETVNIENSMNESHKNLLDVKPMDNIEDNIINYETHDDDFGDFLCVEEVSNYKPETEVDWKNVQIQCANKCLEFLLEGFSIFSSISDKKILFEVLNHDKGVKYLSQLNLISQICKQILKKCYCQSLEDDLTDVMSKLETYLINVVREFPDTSEILDSTKEIKPCYLCNSNCTTDTIEYMLNHYHASCINLLINFVQISPLSIK